MRILLYGNTNNVSLQIALALRRAGVSADLVANNPSPLHDPVSTRARWRLRRPRWILDHAHLTEADYIDRTPALAATLAPLAGRYDFALLTDMGGSIAADLGCRHAFIANGSDVSYYASRRLGEWRSSSWSADFRASEPGRAELDRVAGFVARQREGIRSSRFVIIGPRGHHPDADAILDDLGVPDSARHYWRVVDTGEVRAAAVPTRAPLRLTAGARVDFRPREATSTLDLKGTDVLIEGFARSGIAGHVELHLPRKGGDIAEAEALIRRLGVEDAVHWFPEMPRRSYLKAIRASAIVADSLGPSGPAMVAHDALATGRPVIANLQPEVWEPLLGRPYPGLHATTPEAVAEALAHTCPDPARLTRIGAEGRAFAEEVLDVDVAAARLVERVTSSPDPVAERGEG